MKRKKRVVRRRTVTPRKDYKMHIILSGLALLLVLLFLNVKLRERSESMMSPPVVQGVAGIVGTYRGTLPCADCAGLETELTLNSPAEDSPEGDYVLVETYLGKGNPIVTTGMWTVLPSPNRPGTVVALRPQGSDSVEEDSYYLVDGNKLTMLDREQQDIDSPYDLSLMRSE